MTYRVKIKFKDDRKAKVYDNVVDTFKSNGNLYLTFGVQGQYQQYRLHELTKIIETYAKYI
jgi:hypothetical protein